MTTASVSRNRVAKPAADNSLLLVDAEELDAD